MKRVYVLALKYGYNKIMCKQIGDNTYRMWLTKPQWTDYVGEPVGFDLSPEDVEEVEFISKHILSKKI
jgi:hypothetical protein